MKTHKYFGTRTHLHPRVLVPIRPTGPMQLRPAGRSFPRPRRVHWNYVLNASAPLAIMPTCKGYGFPWPDSNASSGE